MAKKRIRKKADYPWIVPDPRPLAEPIPWRGEQGLFDVDVDL